MVTTTRDLTRQWFVFPRPNPQATVRLFCFPYAGGSASLFRSWGQTLPPSIEVCSIQLPGRESRIMEPAFTQIEPVIETLTALIMPYLDKPFAFFGYSLGTIIAFELARALRRQNIHVGHLFLAARTAPQLPNRVPPMYQLPDTEFIQKVRELNGTPETIFQHPELVQMLIPILRADFALAETYAYKPEAPLNVPLTVLGGTEDPNVRRCDLEAWASQSGSTFALKMLPGDHFFLNSAKQEVIKIIIEGLSPFWNHKESSAL